MEMNILYWIQGLHTPALDSAMDLIFNTIVGDKGQFWVYLGILLLILPKTRRCGVAVLLGYLLAYFIGDGILKNLIARPRPCAVDETVELLVKRPTSYSCPSVHSALAFASAAAVFFHHKKIGIAALAFAALVGLSRMYFFVHYPTDVLFGAAMGFALGWLSTWLVKTAVEYRERAKRKKN